MIPIISIIIITTGVFLLFQAFFPKWYLIEQSFYWAVIKTVGGVALISWAIIYLKLGSIKMARSTKIMSIIALVYGAFLLFETLYIPFDEYITNTLGHFLAKVIGGVALICWGFVSLALKW